MRMKQNGVTTIVIVVIVIVVVAIAGGGAYLATKGGEGEAALGITTTSLSDGVVDVAYSATLVASGGTSPYTWENIGSLPDGLSLSTGGTISGTPTTEGDFSFTVKVTDSVENTDTKALSIHVAAAGAGGAIASATSLDFKIDYTLAGETYTYRFRGRSLTGNADMRIDITTAGMAISYILNSSQHEGWYGTAGSWMSLSDLGIDFDESWTSYYGDFTTYTDWLTDWVSGEWQGTVSDISYRIYDIQVNPTLGDEVFTPS